MSASHASKGGRRWRYYVSRAALMGPDTLEAAGRHGRA